MLAAIAGSLALAACYHAVPTGYQGPPPAGSIITVLTVSPDMPKPPPKEEPKAEVPPGPEPPPRDYIVFFDFDESGVRPDAAATLDRVLRASMELKAGEITLVGHADLSGPDAYNQALSLRRADSVRGYLEQGGATVQMSTEGRGESDPRIPTPDGVREQENRRVEIRLD
jgi:outer membrane protein OmpA-like peptidoglycan-associated protein